jgi:hypothetical protein
MARILLVHGAFNEFWGPHELKARWLPPVTPGAVPRALFLAAAAPATVEICREYF